MCLPIGSKSCFYWASKLPRGTFWAGLKTFKSLAAAFEGLSTAQPSAAALEVCCWLCHGASMCLSIGPTSCFYWASKLPRGTFWAGLKSFKSLAAAFEGLSTAQPSAAALEASCWLCLGASMCLSIGPTSCFYWASKLPRGTFWAGLKSFKSLAAAFEGLSTAQPSAAALEASCWLCHGASMCLSIVPTNCFYWASKLPRGTFWAGLKSFKSLTAAFEGLSTAQPSAAALEASCWLCHGASMCLPIGSKSCFYWASKLPRGTFWAGLKAFKSLAAAFEGLSTAQPSAAALIGASMCIPIGPKSCFYWASKLLHGTFWAGLKSSKAPQQLSKALAPHKGPLALPSCLPIGPTNCFYWALKMLHGTFWAGLKSFKSPAAAFESLSTAQPSACFAIVPPRRPYKLFLLGFVTATWHVLGRP